MKLSRFSERHPYWFVVILELIIIVVYFVVGATAYLLDLSNMMLYGLANLVLTIIVVVMLTLMGWWKTVGFRSPSHSSDLLYFLVPFVPMLVNFIPGVELKNLEYVSVVLAVTLMVGFAEEAIFRGLMLEALKAHGPWKAVIISAFLFGLTHVMNVMTGNSVWDVILQALYSMAIGFAFAALAVKMKILWPLVLAHFLIDFVNFIQKPGFVFSPVWEMVIVTGTIMIFILYGLFVMSKNERVVIVENLP